MRLAANIRTWKWRRECCDGSRAEHSGLLGLWPRMHAWSLSRHVLEADCRKISQEWVACCDKLFVGVSMHFSDPGQPMIFRSVSPFSLRVFRPWCLSLCLLHMPTSGTFSDFLISTSSCTVRKGQTKIRTLSSSWSWPPSTQETSLQKRLAPEDAHLTSHLRISPIEHLTMQTTILTAPCR